LINSFDILKVLKNAGYYKESIDELWWPNSGSFEVVIGAILTQNTRWQNVQKALDNLKRIDALSLESIVNIDIKVLSVAIKPSGFYNTKAKYIKKLALNIKKDFEDFDNFVVNVSRKWLLSQRGIGFESADSILCYACLQDEMVADSYSYRLLKSLGIELEEYEDVKSFLKQGIDENLEEIYKLYKNEVSLNYIYSRFHGKIVEYCKENTYKKTIDISLLKPFLD
jgi:endonuclease-3 related protein